MKEKVSVWERLRELFSQRKELGPYARWEAFVNDPWWPRIPKRHMPLAGPWFLNELLRSPDLVCNDVFRSVELVSGRASLGNAAEQFASICDSCALFVLQHARILAAWRDTNRSILHFFREARLI